MCLDRFVSDKTNCIMDKYARGTDFCNVRVSTHMNRIASLMLQAVQCSTPASGNFFIPADSSNMNSFNSNPNINPQSFNPALNSPSMNGFNNLNLPQQPGTFGNNPNRQPGMTNNPNQQPGLFNNNGQQGFGFNNNNNPMQQQPNAFNNNNNNNNPMQQQPNRFNNNNPQGNNQFPNGINNGFSGNSNVNFPDGSSNSFTRADDLGQSFQRRTTTVPPWTGYRKNGADASQTAKVLVISLAIFSYYFTI